MVKLILFTAINLFIAKKKIAQHLPYTRQAIDAVSSGSFEFTFYMQCVWFICCHRQFALALIYL